MIFPLSFMGEDFLAEIDITVTSWGCEARIYGPPEDCYPAEPPEWDVESIVLWLDDPNRPDCGLFEATGALFDVLSEHFADAIAEQIAEAEAYADDWDPD